MKTSKDPSGFLDPKVLSHTLKPGGLLSQNLPFFEERTSQAKLLEDLVEVLNSGKVGLFEAGTGVGKTFAYLIPSIVWALQNQDKVLISTQTIPLQEQILAKDIPFLKKFLNIEFEACLVKGMNNYLCLRKLEDLKEDPPLFSENLSDQIEGIRSWSESTVDGSKSSLDFSPSKELWEKVSVDMDACNRHQCPFYSKCFFFKERKKALDAQLIIANHHIFFSDFFNSVLEDAEGSIFPLCNHVIFDEAHHLEDTAISRLSFKINSQEIHKVLQRLFSEDLRSNFKGCFSYIKDQIVRFKSCENSAEIKELLNSLSLDLPALRREIELQSLDAFSVLEELVEAGLPDSERGQGQDPFKLRLTESLYNSPLWRDEVTPAFKDLIGSVEKFTANCFFATEKIKRLFPAEFNKKIEGKLLDLKSLLNRLNAFCDLLSRLFESLESAEWVCWLEGTYGRSQFLSLNFTQINVSSVLKEHLYPYFSSVSLLSATLSTDQNFNFIKKSLGIGSEIKGQKVLEKIYSSPFNYQKQAMLLCPTDLPSPSSPHFLPFANKLILNSLKASNGSAFILFTSYASLKSSADFLVPILENAGMPCFIQGSAPRISLLEEFKETENAVLFGTDSFWEGVDVIGDKLKLVVIAKLPFSVPTDPLVQAKSERLAKERKSSFIFDSLPRAIVKFKQGFGRLIRSKTDKGCILCLDSRLVNKGYGKSFLDSLPEAKRVFGTSDIIVKNLNLFYGREDGV